MAVYNFQAQFVAPIQCGAKRHTIRKAGRGHARVGGPVTLQTGSRFKPRRLGTSVCTRVGWIALDFQRGEVRRLYHELARLPSFGVPLESPPDVDWGQTLVLVGRPGLNHFAQSDGFEDWEHMRLFWRKTHDADRFEGVIIEWGEVV